MQPVPGEVELEDADRPEYFEVETILRWRWSSKTRRRHREFLVLWQGYPAEDAEWIPTSFSVTRTHFKGTYRPTESLRSISHSFVSVGRNFLHGGSSCGNFGSVLWGCHGHWLGVGVTLELACHFGKGQCYCPGRISRWVPIC